MAWYQWEGDSLLLTLRIQPRARHDEIVGPYGEHALKVRINAPPVDGKANLQLLRMMAKAFGVALRDVTLISGESGRDKRLRIDRPQQLPLRSAILPRL